MAVVIGILFLALGSVLVWRIDWSVSGVDVAPIGVVLMAVGGAVIVASLLVSPRATSGSGQTGEPAWESPTSRLETQSEDEGQLSDGRSRRLPRSL